jgi:hypothetical protein
MARSTLASRHWQQRDCETAQTKSSNSIHKYKEVTPVDNVETPLQPARLLGRASAAKRWGNDPKPVLTLVDD